LAFLAVAADPPFYRLSRLLIMLSPFSYRSVCALLAFFMVCASSAPAQSSKKNPTPTRKSSSSRNNSHNPNQLIPDQLGVAMPPAPTPAPSQSDLPEIVATIDGDAINKAELERVFSTLLSANGRNLSELSPAERRKGYRSVLDEMIIDRLVSKQSSGLTVSDQDIERRLDTLKKNFSSQGSFEEELKKTGQNLDQVKANIRAQLQQQQWIESMIADQVRFTPEEVDKFYKDNPERFSLPEMVRASHILLAVRRDGPPETVWEKEKLATSLVERIKKGESFEELAKQFSDDPTAKQTGGDLDYFSRDRIMPEFADVAFRLQVGEVSAPVRTQFGFHIIKLTDHKLPRTASLEETRPQITAFLQEGRRRDAINRLLASLRESAKIEIKLP
jgi:parvulin-like peptidyl-prolyl isomerase